MNYERAAPSTGSRAGAFARSVWTLLEGSRWRGGRFAISLREPLLQDALADTQVCNVRLDAFLEGRELLWGKKPLRFREYVEIVGNALLGDGCHCLGVIKPDADLDCR